MQDIKRSELLDKLAAGWKVRRKEWSSGDLFGIEICRTVSAKQLLADGWEGEPPEPALMYKNCAITFAFEKLRNGAAFIRRTAWKDKDKRYTQGVFSISLQVEELLATDWEVWG